MPPRRRKVTVDLSDEDSAARQLLIESQASQAASLTSAERSANLLNAARASRTRSALASSGDMAQQKVTAGKLKRPTFKSANLPKAAIQVAGRRKDVYDPSVSPEKKRALFELKEPANKKHPNERVTIDQDVHDGPSRRSGRLAGEKADMSGVSWEKRPESYSTSSLRPKRKADTAPGGSARRTKSPRKSAEPIPLKGREHILAKGDRGKLRNSVSHPHVVISAQKPSLTVPRAQSSVSKGSPQPVDVLTEPPDDSIDKEPVLATIEEKPPTAAGHQEAEEGLLTTANHGDDIFDVEPTPPPISKNGYAHSGRDTHAQPVVLQKSTSHPTRNTTSIRTGQKVAPIASALAENLTVEPEISPSKLQHEKTTNVGKVRKANTGRPTVAQRPRVASYANKDLEDVVRSSKENIDDSEAHQPSEDILIIGEDEEQNAEEEYQDEEEEDDDEESGAEEQAVYQMKHLADIDRVFGFVDSGDREGSCQTAHGKKIRRACIRYRDALHGSDATPEDVADISKIVIGRLSAVHLQKDREDQVAFKEDAYAYIFFSLARFLEAVYDWSKEHFGDPLLSPPALHLILPLMKKILLFQDTISAWKISLPQRYKGDRMARNVHQRLIAPLRRMEEQHRLELRRLEDAERIQEIRKKQLAERQREEVEIKRKAQAAELSHVRREQWQHLHFWRLRCASHIWEERKHLFMPRLRDKEEFDANGVRIERVDIFNARSTPVAHRALGGNWTGQQLEALVEGLEKYASPEDPCRVFVKIFHEYCRDRGPLRGYNVTEITSQAAYIRSSTIDRCQSNGWPIPEWVKAIPVILPP